MTLNDTKVLVMSFDGIRAKRTILLITITVIVTLIISSIVAILWNRFSELSFPSGGVIRTLGVEAYWDADLTEKTESIDWGTIWPGTTKNVTLYILSVSNIETTLELRTANWTFRDSDNMIIAGPSDSSLYMNLTWNYNEKIVRPGETVQVKLTLSISTTFDFERFLAVNDVRGFSFDIIISTSEYGG